MRLKEFLEYASYDTTISVTNLNGKVLEEIEAGENMKSKYEDDLVIVVHPTSKNNLNVCLMIV